MALISTTDGTQLIPKIQRVLLFPSTLMCRITVVTDPLKRTFLVKFYIVIRCPLQFGSALWRCFWSGSGTVNDRAVPSSYHHGLIKFELEVNCVISCLRVTEWAWAGSRHVFGWDIKGKV